MSSIKLLIFSFHQFGQLVDSLKYCEQLSGRFEITYLGWDYNLPRVELPGVEVKYISRKGSLPMRNFRLLSALNKEIATSKYDVCFLHYTRGISFVRILHFRKKMIFDIRSLSVSGNSKTRWVNDLFLKIESRLFKNYSVISEGIAKKIKLSQYSILPLGADFVNRDSDCQSDELKLLYVGTLEDREIIKCVKGIEQYIQNTGDTKVKFKIVGDGPELKEICNYIIDSPTLLDKVECTGRIPHNHLKKYFNWANAGVSFIPIKDWYNFQPATKTFEYLLAGLPVIATITNENEKLLSNEPNCVLIRDTVEDFARSIEEIKIILKSKIETNYFQEKYRVHSWSHIVENKFLPIITNAK